MKHLLIAIGLLISACSSTGTRIIETADDLSRPGWASTVMPSFTKDGKIYFVGHVEVSGDSSKSAALNMSDEKTMSEPLRALADEFLDQNQVGEELRKEASVGQRVISATRGYRPPMPGLKVVGRYWELRQTGEYGPTNLTAFSLVELPLSDYESAKAAYLSRLAGNSEVKKILADVGEKQRRKIMGE